MALRCEFLLLFRLWGIRRKARPSLCLIHWCEGLDSLVSRIRRMNSPTWMYFVMYEYNPRERPSHNISTNNLCESVQVSHQRDKAKMRFLSICPYLLCAKYVTKIANFQRRTLKSFKINMLTAKNQANHTSLTILFLEFRDKFLW